MKSKIDIKYDKITFGSYPQSLLEDDIIIKELNDIVGEFSKDKWTPFDYYNDNIKSNYMFYYDIEHNGIKYRGVYMLEYRPYSLSDNHDDIGTPDLTILELWKPEYKVKDILVSIFSLFYMYKIDSPCSIDMANELKNNKALYKEKIRYFTKKYANPISNHGIKTIWDFTYQH